MRERGRVVDTQLVQLLVLDSTVQMVPGIVELVQYSVDDIGPKVPTALPALHWVPCTRANGVTARRQLRGANAIAWPR